MKAVKLIILFLSVIQYGCNTNRHTRQNLAYLNNNIECTLEIQKDTFKVKEEVLVSFVITNNSDKSIFTDNSPYGMYINEIKYGGFNIQVENETGEIIQPKQGVKVVSGRFGIIKIEPNETRKILIRDLHEYQITDKEGQYKITVEKKLDIYRSLKNRKNKYPITSKDFKKHHQISKSITTNLRVNK